MRSKVAIILASLGRPNELTDLLERLRKQAVLPDQIVLSVTSESDLPAKDVLEDVDVVIGDKGLPRQRNKGLGLMRDDIDYVVFFDDDYLPAVSVVSGIRDFFDNNPDIVGMMGEMLADGINGPGLSKQEAEAIISEYEARPPKDPRVIEDVDGLYGCNMAYRVSSLGDTLFDENLPLYGWQEDWDFANQWLKHGRLVITTAFAGVHRGVKASRSPGQKFGYSQIANPLYLVRKGTMSKSKALTLMSKNIVANHLKVLRPEPWVDRRGRLIGNWIAFKDLLTGRLDPNRISSI